MKPALYWISALALVVALVLSMIGLAELVMTHHSPFHQVWGAFIVLLGIVCIVAGKVSPSSLWKPRWRGDQRVVVSSSASQISTVIGIAFVAGGAVYAFTSEVWYLIGAMVIVAAFTRLLDRKITGSW